MKTLSEMQRENAAWAKYNFGDKANDTTAFHGMVEEIGELSHARLKSFQGIRDISADAERDAIGDLAIYMMHYCSMRGWDLHEIIDKTWNEVQERDWVKFKKNGLTE